jgi:hypothetical protein
MQQIREELERISDLLILPAERGGNAMKAIEQLGVLRGRLGERTERPPIIYEARCREGVWRVEAVDHPSEGEIYLTKFYGPGDEARAREYAEWKNRHAATSARGLNQDAASATISPMHVCR